MKVLHTADWHLGQTFMQKSRIEEHQMFVDWLINTVEFQEIEYVIIAGDVFDVTNPSIEAMDLYHYFLLEMYKRHVQVIVVGGNHDSAARLNTTGALLKLLNVHVVGGDTSLGQIIPLENSKTKSVEAVVVAVPYLRDGDLRKISEGEEVVEAHQKFAMSIKKHYDELVEQAVNQYSNLPMIGTAHLYVTGSTLSDSSNETMHAIGTLGQIPSQSFSSKYAYMALGHIHKPQVVKHPEDVPVKYAGSPIPLSFSERDDLKEITIIEIYSNQLSFASKEIPLFRSLKRFKGEADDIIQDIENFSFESNLTSWVELIITSPTDYSVFNDKISTLCKEKNIEVLSRQLELKKDLNHNIRTQYEIGLDNNPLDDVAQIFKLRCEKMGLNEDNIKEINPLFEEIFNQLKN